MVNKKVCITHWSPHAEHPLRHRPLGQFSPQTQCVDCEVAFLSGSGQGPLNSLASVEALDPKSILQVFLAEHPRRIRVRKIYIEGEALQLETEAGCSQMCKVADLCEQLLAIPNDNTARANLFSEDFCAVQRMDDTTDLAAKSAFRRSIRLGHKAFKKLFPKSGGFMTESQFSEFLSFTGIGKRKLKVLFQVALQHTVDQSVDQAIDFFGFHHCLEDVVTAFMGSKKEKDSTKPPTIAFFRKKLVDVYVQQAQQK
eukprot:2214076-Rhodomonas_salina.1